jgi:hypothetical protein
MVDLKLIPLPYYDIILGIDWFQKHSPMNIDWVNKWMILQSDGVSIQLHFLDDGITKIIPTLTSQEAYGHW